jgi:hypothetical protein
MQNEILNLALKYFNEEGIDSSKPLYGIYKALEIISKNLGKNGWKKLAKLAGENEKFISEITETAQIDRHSKGYQNVKKVLTEKECQERSQKLIKAYADSI